MPVSTPFREASDQPAFLAGCVYVGTWHNPDLRPLADLGLLTAALPTFGTECRLIGAFQTQRQVLLKVAV